MKADRLLQADGSSERSHLEVKLDLYKAIFAVVILFTIITRLYGLAYKPYHHDESLYATYSWYLYEGRGYRYDPMMHGPATFYLNALTYSLFGDNDFTARLPAAFFGIALVCCTPLLKRYLGRTGSLAAAVLFAVSPTYMYFSRFLRHDIFVAFWAFLSVAFFMRYLDIHKRSYIYGLGIALAFMFCSKINAYLYLFVFVTFLAIMKLFERYSCNTASESLPRKDVQLKRQLKLFDVIITTALFFGIFYLFYTSFFTNKAGFVDGLYRKSLSYWFHQNTIHRIRPYFTELCPIAATYEFPLLIVVFSGLIALLNKKPLSRVILTVSFIIAIPLMIFWRMELPYEPWSTWFHVTNTMHAVFALYVCILGMSATILYLRNGQRFPAFLSYWSFMSVLLYSYEIGKVPWHLVHVLLPFILWGSFLLDEFMRSERFKRATTIYGIMMAIGLMLFLQASIRLCFFNEANPAELMVYSQTSMDIKEPLKEISSLAKRTGQGLNLPIGVQGESSWPFTWYLRNYKNWFQPGRITKADKTIFIVDWKKKGDYKKVLDPNYEIRSLKLREWWVPKPVRELDTPLTALLRYYFFRDPWSATGSQDIAFCVREDLIREGFLKSLQ